MGSFTLLPLRVFYIPIHFFSIFFNLPTKIHGGLFLLAAGSFPDDTTTACSSKSTPDPPSQPLSRSGPATRPHRADRLHRQEAELAALTHTVAKGNAEAEALRTQLAQTAGPSAVFEIDTCDIFTCMLFYALFYLRHFYLPPFFLGCLLCMKR